MECEKHQADNELFLNKLTTIEGFVSRIVSEQGTFTFAEQIQRILYDNEIIGDDSLNCNNK